jgi:undecaprenyl-phosphate 4-deoxy-4-formamido-L-arabinose transferase
MNGTNNLISISIVIPVYNSEDSIGEIVDKLVSEFQVKYDLEIILVNDNSRDKSEQVCISLYEKYKDIINFLYFIKKCW